MPLMTPVVTEFSSPRGLPMATTVSPIIRVFTSANRTALRLAGRLNPDQGKVIEGVDLDDLRLRHGAVAKHGIDGRRPVHDMGIGDDEAGLVDDDAGAQALELHRPLGVVLAEVLFEEAVEPLAVLAPGGVLLEIDEALRADVHDGGGIVPDNLDDGRFTGAFHGRGTAGEDEDQACEHGPNEYSFPVHGMPPYRKFS